MAKFRNSLLIAFLAILTACGGQSVWAPDEEVEKRRYVSNEPAYLELKTMINNRTGRGGHTSLVINGSQLVMWDPAGRWFNSLVPERNDVLYGLTPTLMKRYDSFHARATHHVVVQRIPVSPQVAEMAMQLAMNNGPALDATCALTTSRILKQLPGFENIRVTYFPVNLMKQFGRYPGVVTTKIYENDEGKN